MQRTLLAAVLFAGFLAGAVGISILLIRGAGSADPLSAIPAGAMAVITIPSVPDLMHGLARSRLAGAHQDDGWDLAAWLVSEISDARGLAAQPEGTKLARGLRGGAAIGILPASRPGAAPDLVVAVELGSRDDAFLSWFEASMLPTLAGGEATSTRRTHRGHEYLVIKARGTGAHLCITGAGRLAIATTTRAAMEESLSALTGHEPSISSSAAFRAVHRELGRHADILAYLTKAFVEGAIRGAPGVRREGRADWRRALASAQAEAVAVAVRVDPDGLFRERVRIWIPAMSETLPGRLFGGRPRPITAAAELPEGYALYAGAAFGHAESLSDRIPSWLGPAIGQDPDKLRDRILGLQEFLDTDFRRDFFSTIGDQIAIAADPEVSRSTVVALEPTDDGAMRRLLHRLDGLARAADLYQGPGEEGSGVTTYRLPGADGFTPSYLVSGSRLLVGASPRALAALGERRRRIDHGPDAQGPLSMAPPAHVVLAVETEFALAWVREHAPMQGGVSSEAWLRRIGELLPASAGPLPRTTAGFVVTRDGVSGEWVGPASPTLLAVLMLISPGPPSPEEGQAEALPSDATIPPPGASHPVEAVEGTHDAKPADVPP